MDVPFLGKSKKKSSTSPLEDTSDSAVTMDTSDGGPAWLSEPESTNPGGEAGDAPRTFALNETQQQGDNADGGGATSADDKELPSIVLFMRLANMGAAAILIIVSIFNMVGLPPISTFILAIYATCGGLLVCCLETQLKFLRVVIALNFGFLFSPFLRFLFYFILASVALAYDDLSGKIACIVIVATAVFNTYVLIRYPAYRAVREKIAEEEDRRIEAKISDGIKRQAVESMFGGQGQK